MGIFLDSRNPYENGCVSIPNKELMDSYAAAMKKVYRKNLTHRH